MEGIRIRRSTSVYDDCFLENDRSMLGQSVAEARSKKYTVVSLVSVQAGHLEANSP